MIMKFFVTRKWLWAAIFVLSFLPVCTCETAERVAGLPMGVLPPLYQITRVLPAATAQMVLTTRLRQAYIVTEPQEGYAVNHLQEEMWHQGIGTAMYSEEAWLSMLEGIGYEGVSLQVVMGTRNWMISRMLEAKSIYKKLQLNIQNTQWLWVLQEVKGDSEDQHSSAQNSITSFGQEMMKSCVEGTRGILIRVVGATGKRVAIYVVKEFGNSDRELSLVAHWSPFRGIHTSPRWSHGLWPLPPPTFQGRLVKISYAQKPAVLQLKVGGKLEDARGYMADLGRLLQERLHFTPQMVLTKGFGSRMSNGTWTGIVGALQRKEAEWGIMDMTATVSRATVVDSSRFLSWDPVVIMSRAPDFVQNELSLLMVFSVQVWSAVAFVLVVSASFLAILANLHSRLVATAESPTGFRNYAFTLFAVLTYQGDIRWTKTWGWREVGICGLFVSFLIHALYCGYVTAYLAIPFRSKPIDSLEDLLSSDISPAFRSRTATYQLIMDPNNTGIITELRSRMLDFTGSYINSWAFFKQVHAGELAYIDSLSSAIGRSLPYESIGAMCKFYISKWVVRTNNDVFFYTKNSPLRYRIDYTIKWLCYYGIIEKIRKSHYSVPCTRTLTQKELEPLDLGQARAVFYLWFLGISASIMAFCIEMLSSLWTQPGNGLRIREWMLTYHYN